MITWFSDGGAGSPARALLISSACTSIVSIIKGSLGRINMLLVVAASDLTS